MVKRKVLAEIYARLDTPDILASVLALQSHRGIISGYVLNLYQCDEEYVIRTGNVVNCIAVLAHAGR